MDRRSMDRKLRSSLQKGRVSHTPPATPKPTKKMRLSASNNQMGNQSSEVSNATNRNESDNVDDSLQFEKVNESGAVSMSSKDLSQSENTNDSGVESMQSDLQIEKVNESGAASISSGDLLQSEKASGSDVEPIQLNNLSTSTSNTAQSEQSAK